MTSGALQAARVALLGRLTGVGTEGLHRLGEARVLAVGGSAQAAPGLLVLALAGVGTIWLDDPEPVTPADAGRWPFLPAWVGEPREQVVAEALQARCPDLRVGPRAEGEAPTAALIQPPSLAQASAAADRARRGGTPHVVVESDGDGGSVVVVPAGAPCFSCARSTGSGGRPPAPGAAALSALAAGELVAVIACGRTEGRRIDLVRGVPAMRLSTRLAGCSCGGAIGG